MSWCGRTWLAGWCAGDPLKRYRMPQEPPIPGMEGCGEGRLMGGASSRRKGHDFERWVARQLREAYPGTSVYRSMQSDGPHQSDVVISGSRLWVECQCSRRPTPLAKLKQAEEDSAMDTAAPKGFWRPLAVWREHGARTTFVTMRYATLSQFTDHVSTWQLVVTLDFDDFLGMLKARGS